MSETVEIRDYRPTDGAACHGLRRVAFVGTFRVSLSPEVIRAGADSYSAPEFTERISSMKTLVAVVAGVVVGFCTTRLTAPHRAEILYLYINAGYRGAGVGSQLVCQSERQVLDSNPGISLLYLDTAVPDYNQAFWECMGYQFVGSSTCDYPGAQIRAVRLEKAVGKNNG